MRLIIESMERSNLSLSVWINEWKYVSPQTTGLLRMITRRPTWPIPLTEHSTGSVSLSRSIASASVLAITFNSAFATSLTEVRSVGIVTINKTIGSAVFQGPYPIIVKRFCVIFYVLDKRNARLTSMNSRIGDSQIPSSERKENKPMGLEIRSYFYLSVLNKTETKPHGSFWPLFIIRTYELEKCLSIRFQWRIFSTLDRLILMDLFLISVRFILALVCITALICHMYRLVCSFLHVGWFVCFLICFVYEIYSKRRKNAKKTTIVERFEKK